jgi:hypothetical protein
MQKKQESKRQLVRGALARGYCDKRNKKKILDPVLIESMTKEIMKISKGVPNAG